MTGGTTLGLADLILVAGLAALGSTLADLFVRRYRAQGLPVASWFPANEQRGSAWGVAACFLALLVGTEALLWARGVTLGVRMGVLGVTTLLAVVGAVDLAVHRIPNALVAAVATVGSGVALAVFGIQPGQVLLGALVGGLLFLLVALLGRGAMGMGDVKLAAALGALLGFPQVIVGLALGIIAGGLAALALLLAGKVGRKDYIAYGPYLAFGAWLVIWAQVWGFWPR